MVLPLVPVMPTSVSSSLGLSYSVAASAASEKSRIRHLDPGPRHVARRTDLGNHGDGAAMERLTRKRRAVGIDTTERNKYGTRPCLPGVVRHGGHVGVADGRVVHIH